MTRQFRLPDLGEGLPEAEIVQWHVAEGDTVTLNQTLAEVETAKAVVEIPSPFAGVVRTLHAREGELVEVGAPLVSVDPETGSETPSGDDTSPHASAGPERSRDTERTEDPVPANLVGYGAAADGGTRPRRRRRSLPAARPAVGDTAVLEAAPHDAIRYRTDPDALAERPRSTPPVRRLAKELGVDIALVAPSGPAGAVTREDVEAAAARQQTGTGSPTAQSAPAPAGRDRETRIPIRGVRRRTAEAMVASAFTAPHATTFLTVDVSETTALISRLRESGAFSGARIGVLAVVAKAVCLALRRHPSLNSRWDQDAGEIVEFGYVNLGIAAATPRGLLVPRIADAETLSLGELAASLAALTERARAGTSTPAELTGSTFSITNVGVFGVDAGTPLLNPGEAGILAVGAVRRIPWEYRGDIALRDVMTLSLSFDHRVVDGEQGARFLRDVADVLRDPARAMLLM
ncbi:dihydrolipoamide acetyltransferase family protein [Microbacterium aquimaris]|uniref:Dihydrolipoamide acetyltransferase component of pyruvate dehydrogenase complex n=1 Tax=Microbacterium aquimaris TaxID=459816 RepID=A0ABU5N8S9_9MICO|nr:dihydrolipoamide acetyltransferase family protein [Microbacterium aquimaris]MDZ8162459.1 dihydrolipoamide acetyltransferase family protein [Microbacterium aquimaris]